MIVFELSQMFWEEECLRHLGITSWESADAHACYGGTVEESDTTVSLPTDDTAVTVMDLDGSTYRISSAELARLLNGEAPAAGAPAGFALGGFAFVVTVHDGVAVTAGHVYQS